MYLVRKDIGMEVIKINEGVLVFYLEGKEYPITSTVLFKGNKAILFDTMDNVENCRQVKNHLLQLGIKYITVVNTHWHWDHIGGNSLYQDCTIIAHSLCKEAMEKNKSELEEKFPVFPPNLIFDDRIVIYLDQLKLELINTVIHSRDSIIGYLPQLKLLIAGDTLEDPLPYIDEVEDLPDHINNIGKLKKIDIKRIIPSHGNKRRYYEGGYDKTLVNANYAYLSGIMSQIKNKDIPGESVGDCYGPFGEIRESYRSIHRANLDLVRKHFGES